MKRIRESDSHRAVRLYGRSYGHDVDGLSPATVGGSQNLTDPLDCSPAPGCGVPAVHSSE